MKRILIFLLLIGMAAAQSPLPIFYGEAYNGLEYADEAIVTLYPFADDTDILTDVVGANGATGTEGHWKINLNNLGMQLQPGDEVVVVLDDSSQTTTRLVQIPAQAGTHFVGLNLEASMNDYDEDGHFGDTDCDDNDDTVYPGAEDICDDGIDQDCDGQDSVCVQGEMTGFTIYEGWTLFALPLEPADAEDSQQFGDLVMDSTDLECDVIMRYDGPSQLWIDDVLTIEDPVFGFEKNAGYFVHCDGTAEFEYDGMEWD